MAIRGQSGRKQEAALAALIREQEPDCAAPEAQPQKATLIPSEGLFFFLFFFFLTLPPAEEDKISVATTQRPCRETEIREASSRDELLHDEIVTRSTRFHKVPQGSTRLDIKGRSFFRQFCLIIAPTGTLDGNELESNTGRRKEEEEELVWDVDQDEEDFNCHCWLGLDPVDGSMDRLMDELMN